MTPTKGLAASPKVPGTTFLVQKFVRMASWENIPTMALLERYCRPISQKTLWDATGRWPTLSLGWL